MPRQPSAETPSTCRPPIRSAPPHTLPPRGSSRQAPALLMRLQVTGMQGEGAEWVRQGVLTRTGEGAGAEGAGTAAARIMERAPSGSCRA